jgi:hypothetical protein
MMPWQHHMPNLKLKSINCSRLSPQPLLLNKSLLPACPTTDLLTYSQLPLPLPLLETMVSPLAPNRGTVLPLLTIQAGQIAQKTSLLLLTMTSMLPLSLLTQTPLDPRRIKPLYSLNRGTSCYSGTVTALSLWREDATLLLMLCSAGSIFYSTTCNSTRPRERGLLRTVPLFGLTYKMSDRILLVHSSLEYHALVMLLTWRLRTLLLQSHHGSALRLTL